MTLLLEFQAATLARAENDIEAGPGTAGFLNGAELCFTKSELDITPATLIGALTAIQADYTGYAPQALVWADPSVADDNTVEVTADPLVFRPTDAVTPNQLYAGFITNAAGTVLYFARQMDEAPVPMESALDQLIAVVRYRPATQTVLIVIT